MFARLTVIAVLVALFTASTAHADAMDEYFKSAARTYWGQSANPRGCGNVTIYHDLFANAYGYSDWNQCTIWIRHDAFWYSGRACMVALHEFGHGYGLGESGNSNDVMYYGTNPGANIPYVRWPCTW